MLHRFKHYRRNLGSRDVLINLIVIAYLAYIFFGRGADAIGFILGGSVIAGALLPRLFLNLLVSNPVRSVWWIRCGQISIIVLLLLNFSGMWTAPAAVWLLACPMIGVLMGMGFWMFSDPRLLTAQGAAYYTAYASLDESIPQEHEYDDEQTRPTHLPPLAR